MKNLKKLHERVLAISIVFLVLVITSTTASATTIYVKEENLEMNALQNAVNSAHSGDTIKVALDDYFEIVGIEGKCLTVQGIKKGKELPTVFGFGIGKGSSVTISGFEITKNGIYLDSGCNRITNNLFYNAENGLYISKHAFNKAKGCPTVSGNTFKGIEKAIYIEADKNPGRIPSFKNNKYINCGVKIGGNWTS
jgi:hypothetical protein